VAKRKSKSRHKGPPRKPKSRAELLIEQKGKKFINCVKEYWQEQEKLHREFNEASAAFDSRKKGEELFPTDASGIVWLLRDGVVFVRFRTVGKHPPFQTRILDISVAEWLQNLWIIPVGKGEVSLAGMFRGSSNITLTNCTFNEIHIDFAHVSHVYYDGPGMVPSIAKAVLDFRLTLLGMIFESGGAVLSVSKQTAAPPEKTVELLTQKVAQFGELLTGGTREEDIQSFLKDNPFLLKPASEVIPKQKLGENFVTDFVLLNILDQGPSYTLIEIERASCTVLTKDKLLAEPVNRAIKQTRDWDVWLEQNKAYIQGKLMGFESPQYLVVIGRSNEMTDEEKAYLRSYNREYKNIALLTYDDLLKQAEEFLESLNRTVAAGGPEGEG
jgi:hypothetical protein